MPWLKTRKRPSIDLGAYRAQIVKSNLDRENPLIKNIIAETGQIAQTWPNLKLDELKALTEKLQQTVATATAEVVPLGDVSFLTVDPQNPKKVVETGITWEKATVKPDMENFVVETDNQVLNDEQVRLDDDLTYTDLAEALTSFLAASHDLGGFAYQELPELPSEEKYVEAVENNQIIHLLPKRLIVSEAAPVGQQANEQASNDDVQATPTKPEVKSSEAASESVSATSQASSEATPAVANAEPVKTQFATQSDNSTVTIASLIKAFDVKTSFFKTESINKKPQYDDFKKAEQILEKEAGVAPLYYRSTASMLNPSVKGVIANPTGAPFNFKYAVKH